MLIIITNNPNKSALSLFLVNLAQIIDRAVTENTESVLMGDHNIDFLDKQERSCL